MSRPMIVQALTSYTESATPDDAWKSAWQVNYCDGFGPQAGLPRAFAAPLPLVVLMSLPNLDPVAEDVLLRFLRTAGESGGFARPIAIDLATAGNREITTGERERGWMFLHWAADMMSHNLVPTFLAHGLDPMARDAQGRTPADIAAATTHRHHVPAFAAWQAKCSARAILAGTGVVPGARAIAP